MQYQQFTKNLPHIFALVILVFIFLFLLANFGYIRPCDIPGFKDIYYGIKGYPRIAIIYGDSGMGDHEALRNVIIERTHQFPNSLHVSNLIAGGVLDDYQLIIVEEAKQIDTSTLYVFRDFVQKGGRLVWIGDAGTGLGEDDYICKDVTFRYLPATEVVSGMNETQVVCGSWVQDTPSNIDGLEGLCGNGNYPFGEVVKTFIEENNSLWENLQRETGNTLFLCEDESITDDPYQISGAEQILNCLTTLRIQGIDPEQATIEEIEQECAYGINYWNRGKSKTQTGSTVNAIDFGSSVLGIDFVGYRGSTQIYLQPVSPDHLLIRGFSTRTDASQWFGQEQFAYVDTSRYSYRTNSLMNLAIGDNVYPAIIVSSPVGPLLTQRGLVIYYAFPPEMGVETNRGVGLIDNLVEFAICQ